MDICPPCISCKLIRNPTWPTSWLFSEFIQAKLNQAGLNWAKLDRTGISHKPREKRPKRNGREFPSIIVWGSFPGTIYTSYMFYCEIPVGFVGGKIIKCDLRVLLSPINDHVCNSIKSYYGANVFRLSSPVLVLERWHVFCTCYDSLFACEKQ